MKRNQGSMLQGPVLWSVISYTIPIILTSVLQLLFNAVDLVMVGRFCGSISVAAVGATGAITNLIINLFIGLSVGAGVTVPMPSAAGRKWLSTGRCIPHCPWPSSAAWCSPWWV